MKPYLTKRDIPEHLLKFFKLKKANRWLLRNKVIWQKPNPMPCSAKDRFTTTWEYLYFFTKSNDRQFYYNTITRKATDRMLPEEKKQFKRDWIWKDEHKVKRASLWRSQRYWFDLNAVRRPHKESSIERNKHSYNVIPQSWREGSIQSIPISGGKKPNWNLSPAGANPGDVVTTKIPAGQAESMGSPRVRQWRKKDCYEATAQEKKESGVSYGNKWDNPAGANPDDFWSIPTQPSALPHYASYPEKLCETPLKAGCPRWICKQCGKARVRVTKTDYIPDGGRSDNEKYLKDGVEKQAFSFQKMRLGRAKAERNTLGWSFCFCLCPACGQADCKCGEKWRPGIVLDPFVGTGVTCKVAKRLGLDWIGIDLKKEYCDIAEKEIGKVTYQEELF